MNIAYTIGPGRGDTDLLLCQLAEAVIAQGFRPVGTVQINTERDCEGPCDMDVRVLPDGPIIRISQSLGRGSRGCRLDPAALESAVGLVEEQLGQGADCLIVNKFGKHEADGRGFRPLIGQALSRNIPVLVGLNHLNAAAFMEFTGDLAVALPPDGDRLADWLREAVQLSGQAA